jgi:hypothetical protein
MVSGNFAFANVLLQVSDITAANRVCSIRFFSGLTEISFGLMHETWCSQASYQQFLHYEKNGSGLSHDKT